MAFYLSFFLLAFVLAISQGRVQKTEVSFRGETFNVTSGCPSKNPEVLRWHEFCTVLWGDTTVCSNRGLGVKRHLVPKYKNICDALCYVSYSKVLKQCPEGSEEEAQPFPLVKHTKVPKPTKVVLEYLQSGYLVKTGCSTRDVRVKRFYGLCLAEYGEETVCRRDRIPGLTIEFPEYTDVCSAMCHHKELRNLNFCPVNGQVFHDHA